MKQRKPSSAMVKTLKQKLPVLFVHIGWAKFYDGTEAIKGNFSFLIDNPIDNSESFAFLRDDDGWFYCGIGMGTVPHEVLHIVLVARDPKDQRIKVVGLYPTSRVEHEKSGWAIARCWHAILISATRRPAISRWPGGQNLRRWAWRAGLPGTEYPGLYKTFKNLVRYYAGGSDLFLQSEPVGRDDEELEAFEGKPRKYFVIHRHRESSLRRAKIRNVLQNNRGKLVCEVAGCGFDFAKRYGDIGQGYAHVHHLRPLGHAAGKGVKTNLRQLAIVCANCHAMIHLGGKNRKLNSLIP